MQEGILQPMPQNKDHKNDRTTAHQQTGHTLIPRKSNLLRVNNEKIQKSENV